MKNNLIKKINWKKFDNLLPVIVQNYATGTILMLGYMNQEALEKTIKQKKVCFYSRTKERLWTKGETSNNFLIPKEYSLDCDNDALLIKAKPKGPTCHTGQISCFHTEEETQGFLSELFEVIQQRKEKMPSDSYTASLFQEGLNKICEKVEEESEEVIRAAKSETKQRVVEESIDVVYHLFVLITQQGISWEELMEEVKKRRD